MADHVVYIGIDNGVTGTIGLICGSHTMFFRTPVVLQQDYVKTKRNVSRVLFKDLYDTISTAQDQYGAYKSISLVERPMVNPKRFRASVSALRALEGTLNALELLGVSVNYVDSKEWQKELLPKGCKGEELKVASRDIGIRMFPQHKELIEKHGDADGILIAEYCIRKFK